MKLIVLGVFMLLSFSEVWAQTMVKLTNGEWAPYQSKQLQYGGVVSRIVTEAFAHVGVKIEYGFFPWKRAYNIAASGSWDGTLVWSKTDEREKDFYFSDPVLIDEGVFFHLKKTSFDWNQMSDLKGYKIGATLSYTYGDEFENLEKSNILRVFRVPQDLQNFKMLLKERIELFPMNRESGYSTLYKSFPAEIAETIVHHPKPYTRYHYHLLLNRIKPEHEQLLKKFNEGLAYLKSSGKYDQYFSESRRGLYESSN